MVHPSQIKVFGGCVPVAVYNDGRASLCRIGPQIDGMVALSGRHCYEGVPQQTVLLQTVHPTPHVGHSLVKDVVCTVHISAVGVFSK